MADEITIRSEDSEWYTVFRLTMEEMGLEAPKELFSSLKSALATIGGIAAGLKAAPNANLLEVIRTIPRYPAVKTVGGIGEVATTIGGYVASGYLGACIGAFIVATLETTGAVAAWERLFRDLARTLGPDAALVLLQDGMSAGGGSVGPMRIAMDIARRSGGKLK